MSRSFSPQTVKLVWGLSAARCAFPGCRLECVAQATEQDGPAILGKIAHIVAHSDTGPRADRMMPINQRDEYTNLILLCGTHHDLVDGQPNTYTIADLRGWKSNHECWVRSSLASEMPQVGFAELEVTTKALLNAPAAPAAGFSITDPRAKMIKNSLTDAIRFLLTMGLAKAHEVAQFIQSMANLDPDFPERLKAGFVTRYRQLRAQGYDGDSLFESMREFSCSGNHGFREAAAGLAVLCYLFEKCEVFEP